MKHFKLAAIVLLGTLFSIVPVRYITGVHLAAAQTKTESKERQVWVNTSSGVYHCPGTRWYGNTKRGEYLGECAAIRDGNRPAYGRGCGSVCSSAESATPSSAPSANANAAPKSTRQAGNPEIKVWINTNSGVYHCPGTRWYGNTKQGEYMTQKKAQDAGNRPAYGKVCQ
jgi:hypothetical protein